MRLEKGLKKVFNESSKTYGYRRVRSSIKSSGTIISEKVVRRIMKEEKLVVPVIRRKRFNSYKGEISPKVENIINRDFKAEKLNLKWLTD